MYGTYSGELVQKEDVTNEIKHTKRKCLLSSLKVRFSLAFSTWAAISRNGIKRVGKKSM